MKSTQEEIKALKAKLKSIDKAFDDAHAWEISRKTVLRKSAGDVEKEIKRLKHLDEMSLNKLHESISLLYTMLRTVNDYCHVEDEVLDIKEIIQHRETELSNELERRYYAEQ